MEPGFFSHSPLAAQSGQAHSLSVHTGRHTPHVFGQSRRTAPGLALHSSSPQMAHCVAFLSSHALAVQRSHDCGHLASTNPGFSWHWPAAAHPGQSSCVSLHSSRQTPQDTGQCLSMKSGFSPQAPADVQPGQSFSVSLHIGVHSPQDVGHAFIMNPALDLQCPSLAQFGHEMSVSLHVSMQVPHECGQSVDMCSALSPEHSPFFAQNAQLFDRSLQ
mmetsp:Transcript_15403/g.39683  ORF Transcript_15403/g.39683 Transcript_15403/m.39683 type:complete len:217 (-) Transcript_15403:106-756(-)|eukprot:CAMPEP_0115866502 /NCGR_PEP_ID=MMETSP0287-20121206/20283_1 /TAXON_ID=412157 /ORGANISM="Chrysochromulina rotalis, Strain UIO044" /LENGTH=216 /DNA_ID=CAMNT_0003321073 /DNA_START=564 /DNA_END=1214 /DNA_ORIENTATION=-